MLTTLIVLSATLLDSCPPARGDRVLDAFAAGVRAARTRLGADGGSLWGRPLHGEWLGFRQVGRVICGYASAPPAAAGFVAVPTSDGDTLWAGVMPSNVNPANTSIGWAGRRWAGIVLPLTADTAATTRLLLHELVHTLQPDGSDSVGRFIPRPVANEGGDGSDQLEGAEGRMLLRLELRALARALATPDDARRRAAARDALRFRHVRYTRAATAEQQRQRALDLGEGLPEYTGWRLATPAGDLHRLFAERIERAERTAGDSSSTISFTRSFPYLTGPAYALLLDDFSSGWRERVIADGADANLQMLLATALRFLPRDGDVAAAQDAAAKYDGRAVQDAEVARSERVESSRRALRARFIDGATLRLRPGALDVVFDPGGQTSLGASGTVMRGFVWKGKEGAELRAPAGALVTSDWQEIRVPLDSGAMHALETARAADTLTIMAEGWTLRLPPGWRIQVAGTSRVIQPIVR